MSENRLVAKLVKERHISTRGYDLSGTSGTIDGIGRITLREHIGTDGYELYDVTNDEQVVTNTHLGRTTAAANRVVSRDVGIIPDQ